MTRRVVITSYGVITPLGNYEADILKNIRDDTPSFSRPGFARDIVVSPVENFNIKKFTGRFKYSRYLNRGSEFGLAAAIQCAKNSSLKNEDLNSAGLFCGAGPNFDITGDFPEIIDKNLDHDNLSALWILKYLPNTMSSLIAQYLNIHGDNLTICTACAASTQAIGEAFRKIKHGYLDTALAGGGDSRINRGGILSYRKAGALYTGNIEPARAGRPFDRERDGFIPGEGGAFFILEELGKARKRKAPIIAEVCGFGSSIDGHNMTAPDPGGESAERAIRSAIAEAGISPAQINMISTHGTGTVQNDRVEAEILQRIFSDTSPHITAFKSWIGHTASACGAVELALSLVCLRNKIIPKIRNLVNPCNGHLNFARNPAEKDFSTILLENFGFGGQNSAIVIKSWSDD